jgi:uncharacterized membrane protein
MDLYILFLLLSVAIIKSSKPIIQKVLVKDFSNEEFIFIMHFMYVLVFFAYLLVLLRFYPKRFSKIMTKWNQLSLSTFSIMTVMCILGIISGLCFYKLLKSYNVNYIVPLIRGINNIVLILLTIFILNEKITYKKILGIIFIISGITLVGRK